MASNGDEGQPELTISSTKSEPARCWRGSGVSLKPCHKVLMKTRWLAAGQWPASQPIHE